MEREWLKEPLQVPFMRRWGLLVLAGIVGVVALGTFISDAILYCF